MTIPPNLPRNDREALVLIAWHALLTGGDRLPHVAADEAFEAADWMLRRLEEQRGENAR